LLLLSLSSSLSTLARARVFGTVGEPNGPGSVLGGSQEIAASERSGQRYIDTFGGVVEGFGWVWHGPEANLTEI
jgi:hypothetical protein